MKCRICHNEEGNQTISAREMMQGTREWFDYVHCAGCGSLQIATLPVDPSIHYRGEYYSYAAPRHRPGLRGWLNRRRDAHTVLGGAWPGGLVARRYRPAPGLRALQPLGLDRQARILDVGCGGGELLFALREIGFGNLLGADPFNEKNLDLGGGLKIVRRTIDQIEGPWDVVMMHHSLEHVPDPTEVLTHAARLLAPGGHCLVRVPVMPSLAWELYGPDWVQLDAPRHLYLYSLAGLDLLVARAGLETVSVTYDSTPFQFWGSEQYRRDLPLSDARSYGRNPGASVFSTREIREFERLTVEANRTGRGDQVAVLLRKSG